MDLDLSKLGEFVASVGFPILAAVMLWVFMRNRLDSSDKQSLARETAMAQRINKLEDKIEDELTQLVHQQGQIIQQCSQTLRDSHSVIATMRDK